jgi:hypothetical protein
VFHRAREGPGEPETFLGEEIPAELPVKSRSSEKGSRHTEEMKLLGYDSVLLRSDPHSAPSGMHKIDPSSQLDQGPPSVVSLDVKNG